MIFFPIFLFIFTLCFLGSAKVEKLQTEQIDFEKLLNKSKDLMNEIKLQDLHESTKTVIEEIRKVPIKPYTESQLSALYHNSELETLDTFIAQYIDAELKGEIFNELKSSLFNSVVLNLILWTKQLFLICKF